MRLRSLATQFALVSCVLVSGCGLALQSIAGFSEETTVRQEVSRDVSVESEPVGAEITRIDDEGDHPLGTAPLVDHATVYETTTTKSSRVGWLALGILGDLAAVIGVAVATRGCEDSCSGGAVIGFSLASLGMMVDSIGAFAWGIYPDEVLDRKVEEERVIYRAQMPGFLIARRDLMLTENEDIIFRLGKGRSTTMMLDDAVVAVMPVKLSVFELASNTDLQEQLRVAVTRQGLRVIDRGIQEQALRREITALKLESYQDCYDEACQVELGNALSATHLLRSSLSQFGEQCVLTVELIDLRIEASVWANSTRDACTPEALLDMSTRVTDEILVVANK